MKYITILAFVLIAGSVIAQPCGINYNYDNAGNRIKKYYCWGVNSLTQNDTILVEEFVGELELEDAADDFSESEEVKKREVNDVTKLLTFPNPTSGVFQIRGGISQATDMVYITNNQGKLIKKSKYNDGYFDMTNQTSGIYYIMIVHDEGKISSTKIIISEN